MLFGHLPPAAARSAALGRLPNSQHLQLAISLPLRNQPALAEFLRQLSDPTSPNYRHYLTPAQFAEKYGPTEADYLAVIQFGRSHGLKITGMHPNRTLVDVEGTVPQIEKTFHVTMWNYQHPSEARKFYSPDTEPSIDLAVPILGVSGLNNYSLPHPRYKRLAVINPSAPYRAMANTKASPSVGTGPGSTYMGDDFRTAYVSGTTLTGTGQSVGLLQFDGYSTSDITYYETQTGRPNVPITNVLLDGFSGAPTGNGGEVEVSLDIEMTISMAPGVSNILVYEAGPNGDWHDILNRMATDNVAKQLSCSWYIPGGAMDTSADQIFQQMAAQGQSFYSASGDSDAFTGLIPFPGDTPYVTEVGGTTLTTTGTGGTYSSETVWNRNNGVGSGGGISTQYAIPTWQQGINMAGNLGSTSLRNVPDVAMTAENVYVRADGVDQSVGGTSCAAPLWAGFTALVNQQAVVNTGTTVGFINPAVYAIGKGNNYTFDFHDTTVGNNYRPSSPTKFPAATGYDLCTGWGTPTGSALVNALAGPPTPYITTTSPLPAGAVGSSYNQTLAASGGTPSYSWSISSGALPTGLSLSVAGVISGTPTATGTASFSVLVTDSRGITSTTPFNLAVYAQGTPIIATFNPLTAGTVGAAYNLALSASGGATPYSWSLTSGTLPLGLTLSSTGVITGTPTTTGTTTFTVQVTGNDGLSSTTPFSMTINPAPTPPIIANGSPLPSGVVGSSYSQILTASGGATPYSWSISSGALPTGLGLGSTGLISGVPTVTGISNFTVRVTGGDGLSSTMAFSLTINPQGSLLNGSFETASFSNWISTDISSPFVPLQVVPNGYSPGYGLFSSTATDGNYSAVSGFDGRGPGVIQIAQDIIVSAAAPLLAFDFRAGWDMLDYGGSTSARTFTVSVQPSGGGTTLMTSVQLTAAPATKNLDTGPITGTVDLSAYAGTTIRVCFNLNVPQSFTGPAFFELDNVRLVSSVPPAITTTGPLLGGTMGTAYSQTLTASGGTTPYSWSLAAGSLPTGLGLSSAGIISGTPTATGTSTFTAQVSDSKNQVATKTFSLTILPPAPVITSALTATATTGVAFTYQIVATNSPTSYGATGLPAGLSVNPLTGLITGSPTSSGSSSITIGATNSGGTGSAMMTLTVQQAPAITNGPPPAANFAASYSFTYITSGYPAPTFSVTSGTLPTGLVLSSAGVISGTPTAVGTFTGTVTATNGVGSVATQNFSIAVQQAPSITNGPPPAVAVVNTAYNFSYTSSGYPAPVFSVISGALPPGLTISSAGVISGTLTTAGTFLGTIDAGNTLSPDAMQSFSITVLTPFQQWLAGNGLSTATADGAVPDGDGVPILLKYATGLTPGTMSVAGPATISSTAANNLVLQFNRLSPAPVNYLVEASPDLAAWTTIASLPAGATSWTTTASIVETGTNPVSVTLTDSAAFTSSAQRFLRLRVTTATDISILGTVPQGDVPINVAASNSSNACATVDNLPVDRNLIQAVTASTLTVPAANVSSSWGNAATPFALRLLSGSGSGATFPITAVNGNVLTLATQGVDLTSMTGMGVAVGDTYEILPQDTLASLFGATGGSFLTGPGASSADNVDLYIPTGVLTYFNNGTNWHQAGSLLNQNNVLLPPGSGWIIVRRGATPLTFYLVGRVPEVALRLFTPPGGFALLSSPYPTPMTLAQTGFASASGWQSGPSPSVTDIIETYNGSGWLTYYYNGTHWRQAGSLLNQDSSSNPAGQIFYVSRQSSPSPNLSFVLQPLTYAP
jgi:hypothetical protein